jgi:hypothetical protein
MIDTTLFVTLENWAPIPQMPGGVAAADTLYGFTLSVYPDPRGTASIGADTISATVQGSFNGTDVAAAPEVKILEIGSSNSFQRQYNVLWSVGASGTLTNVSVFKMPQFRFLLEGGGTYGGAATGQFRAVISYWTTSSTQDER